MISQEWIPETYSLHPHRTHRVTVLRQIEKPPPERAALAQAPLVRPPPVQPSFLDGSEVAIMKKPPNWSGFVATSIR